MSTTLTSKSQWHCYICDLDVPISHIQDHNDAWQHNANVSICQESLKRLNKHIETKNYAVVTRENNNTYFCNICSVVVNNDEAFFHLKSKQHIESDVKGHLLDNFRQFYIDRPNLTEIFYNKVKTNITAILNLHYTETSLIKPDNSMETQIDININELTDQLPDIYITEASYNNDHVEIIECNVKNDSLPLPSVHDTKTPIEDMKQTDSPKKQCEICFVKVPYNNWKDHVKGMNHRLKLKQNKEENNNSLINYQMQRSDNPIVLKCRICSIDVPNDTVSVGTHLESPEHITQYENLMKTNSIEKAKSRLLCLTCDCYMVHEYELYHIDSKNHKLALNSNELLNENDYDKTISILNNDNMKNRSYKLYEAKKVGDGFGNHVRSQENVLMEKKWEDGESITIEKSEGKTSGLNNYSDIDSLSTDNDDNAPMNEVKCKANVKTARLKKSNDEISLMKKPKKGKAKGSTIVDSDLEIQDTNVIYCKVCKENISYKPSKISKHLKSLKHASERRFLLFENKIKVSGFDHNLLHCDWCNIDFDKGTLHEHIINESHKIHVQKLVEYENKVIKHYTRDVKFNRLECVICDDKTTFLRAQGMIDLHIANRHHKTKHEILLSKNKIEKLDDCFCCIVCDAYVEPFQDVVHINTFSHERNLRDFNLGFKDDFSDSD